jgi:hypothetical protein
LQQRFVTQFFIINDAPVKNRALVFQSMHGLMLINKQGRILIKFGCNRANHTSPVTDIDTKFTYLARRFAFLFSSPHNPSTIG